MRWMLLQDFINDVLYLLCCVPGLAEELLFLKDLRSLSLYWLCQELQRGKRWDLPPDRTLEFPEVCFPQVPDAQE